MSSFDKKKNYYVFKYVVDTVNGEPTRHEDYIVAYVKATDPWEAVANAGFDDLNAYGANLMDDENLDQYTTKIADERKHLKKMSKQLKVMTDERDDAVQKFKDERPCPNGCGKLDDKFACPKCGFGHEGEQLVKDLDKLIKDEKKKGNDVSELEAIRDSIKESIK